MSFHDRQQRAELEGERPACRGPQRSLRSLTPRLHTTNPAEAGWAGGTGHRLALAASIDRPSAGDPSEVAAASVRLIVIASRGNQNGDHPLTPRSRAPHRPAEER